MNKKHLFPHPGFFLSFLVALALGTLFWRHERVPTLLERQARAYKELSALKKKERKKRRKEEKENGTFPEWPGKCLKWGKSRKLGDIPYGTLLETSGIAVSHLPPPAPQRLYHHNDGPRESFFFTSDIHAKDVKLVLISGYAVTDPEDMATGPCGENNDPCLFLSDTGDNHLVRPSIKVVVMKEPAPAATSVVPYRVVELVAPDHRALNVESLGVHPKTGDFFLITKEKGNWMKGTTYGRLPPARLFKVKRETWEKFRRGDAPLVLEKMGELDMLALTDTKVGHQMISSMDISPDGKSFVVLTHKRIFEFYYDLSYSGTGKDARSFNDYFKGKVEDRDYRSMSIIKIQHAEAVAFRVDPVDGTWNLIYDSEGKKTGGSPLMEIPCVDQREE